MDDVRGTVQRITKDLNSLLRQLSAKDDTQARELVEELLTSDVMKDFQSSVDATRHLLWIYIEAVSHNRGSKTVVQSTRLQRAVDMLRALHSSPVPEQFAGPETFFEHVQTIVDAYESKEPSQEHDAA
jgi:hypothetical protein